MILIVSKMTSARIFRGDQDVGVLGGSLVGLVVGMSRRRLTRR